MIWVTGTDSLGVTQTTQSPYVQVFTSFYETVESPSSGEIGLGSLTGSVGGIRSYDQTTITQSSSSNSMHLRSTAFKTLPMMSKALLGVGAFMVTIVLLA